MTFVKNRAEINANALTLLAAIHGNTNERELAVGLIGRGRVFYPIEYAGIMAFVPSKFIGYRYNTVSEHGKVKGGRDGKDTNREIDYIIGDHLPDPEVKRLLAAYCLTIGARLADHDHTFWCIEEVKSSPIFAANF